MMFCFHGKVGREKESGQYRTYLLNLNLTTKVSHLSYYLFFSYVLSQSNARTSHAPLVELREVSDRPTKQEYAISIPRLKR